MLPTNRIVSLITGAGKGIGSATAKLLASRHHRVVINYHNSETEAQKLLKPAIS